MTSLELKTAWQQGKVTAGTWVFEFNTPGIARLLASAGVDFIIYDQEHSGFGIDTIRNLLAQTRALNLAGLVRPPANEYNLIAPILDAGASGVIVPNVQTASEAKKVTDACRYTPRGHRGAAFSVAHDDFRAGDVAAKMQAANDAMICCLLIESAKAVENLDEILAVEGVDLIWMGFLDLSLSLGIPGQYAHPRFQEAVDHILQTCKSRRKPVGVMANDPEQAKEYVRKGYRCICYGGDIWLLQRAVSEGIQAVHGLREMTSSSMM